jgi:hypothetical protein
MRQAFNKALRGEEGLQVEFAKLLGNAFRTEWRAYLWRMRPTFPHTSPSWRTRGWSAPRSIG